MMTRKTLFSLLLLFTSACAPTPELPIITPLKPFALKEAFGGEVTPAAMKGKVWVAHLFFTSCPTICPKMMKTVRELGGEVTDKGPYFLSISVDPETDTPDRLKTYALDQKIDRERWKLVTGDEEALRSVATESLKLGTPEEPDLHSMRLVLIDREGNVRGLYSADDPKAVQRLKEDLKSLL